MAKNKTKTHKKEQYDNKLNKVFKNGHQEKKKDKFSTYLVQHTS